MSEVCLATGKNLFMNKDALIATVIGLLIGLIITCTILFGPQAIENIKKWNMPSLPKWSFTMPKFSLPSFSKNTNQTPTVTPANNELKSINTSLTITSPLDEAIVNKDTELISGTASPLSTIIIQSPTEETITVTNADGAYAGKATLSEGQNIITVTSIAKETKKQEQITVTIYYTSEQL